jgi:aspartyl/glutamyl-tRNA(Asn/Gln) amidotransferase C subunit
MAAPLRIDRTLLQVLADTARLHLPAERQAVLQERLAQVLDAFEALAGVAAEAPNLENDPPLLPLRKDVPTEPLAASEVLRNAPRTAASMFLVPRVVEG